MVCIRYHAPANPNLDEYDSPKLGHWAVAAYSRQRLGGRNKITYIAYFLSQDTHPYG